MLLLKLGLVPAIAGSLGEAGAGTPRSDQNLDAPRCAGYG